jgi:hypothetical protein
VTRARDAENSGDAATGAATAGLTGDLTGRIVVLAGPRVIDDDAVEGLRAFAAAGSLGVANTWGAKGVFSWDSPHHLGTCGLQAHDFELLGFGDADTIVTTGLDANESPPDRVGLAPVLDIPPRELAQVAGHVRATEALDNRLYPALAAVAQPGYADDKVPLHPARAAADLGAALPAGGLVVAAPGITGLWVARTFPTPALEPGAPRRVVVPARREPGLALRLAAEAAREGRPAIVVGRPGEAGDDRDIDALRTEGLDLVVVVWVPSAELGEAAAHRRALEAALSTRGVTVLEVPVALEDTRLLLAAAGDVVAWGGIDLPDARAGVPAKEWGAEERSRR